MHDLRQILCGVAVLALLSPTVFAARMVLSFGDMRSRNMSIVLATIENVQQVSRPHPRIPDRQEEGFSFDLKFERVIRQAELPKATKEIEVPFSPSGYSTNWEFGAKPENGKKVMAYLSQGADGSAQLYYFGGAVRLLESFDDPIVEHTKRVIGLWEIESPEELLKIVIAGRYDEDAVFQAYCINALRDGSRSYNDLDLSDVLTHEMALSHIWERYTADVPMPPETLSACENVFFNKLRGLNWESHPARYAVLRRAFRYEIDRPDQPSIWRGRAWLDLLYFPEHSRDNYELMLELVDGPDSLKIHFSRIEKIYQPDSTDPQARELNEKLVAKLVELAACDDAQIANAASEAIRKIAIVQAERGELDDRIGRILRGELPAKIFEKSRLQYTWRRTQELKPRELEAGVEPLSYPWSKLVGKKVSATAYPQIYNKKYGACVSIENKLVWIDGLEELPKAMRGGRSVRVTGELSEAHDLPIFRYEPGKPFQEGLPVPAGYELKDLSHRYLLKNATLEPQP